MKGSKGGREKLGRVKGRERNMMQMYEIFRK